MSAPNWKDVLPAPPPGARLCEAWMTSYDQPYAGLLVEHLLPSLVNASRALTAEPQERMLFFGELGTALEALHGRLTVITSPSRQTREPLYPWLWRYVSHFTVSARLGAVQHAKLWAFHWKLDDEEYLELHVSSTNLTTSAFKEQLQAGWKVSLRLGQANSEASQRTWGQLVPFLNALGDYAGDEAMVRVTRLVSLLGRVDCPADVTFVASIPGRKNAAYQLQQFEPSEVHVLAPSIGEWNERTLSAWSRDVGIVSGKIHLKWISTKHRWANGSGWTLSNTACKTLKASGVQVECIPNSARFSELHRDADPRWSHAKLYLLRCRRRRRHLLVTSANWSLSAWGAGKFPPRNFELGVVFASSWTDLEEIAESFKPPVTVPFCVDRADEDEQTSTLEWAEARWDGKRVDLHARSTDVSTPLSALVTFADNSEERRTLIDGAAAIPWENPDHTPTSARFTQGKDTLEVYVLDLRPPAEFAKTPLPEVDSAQAAALREAFLLQRYGGPAVDAESLASHGGTRGALGATATATDYSVQAWIDARAAFAVIDKWRAALADVKADQLLLERVRVDGQELRAIYARREGEAAAVVVDELGWRLEEEV